MDFFFNMQLVQTIKYLCFQAYILLGKESNIY
jgi:hypothetical protein